MDTHVASSNDDPKRPTIALPLPRHRNDPPYRRLSAIGPTDPLMTPLAGGPAIETATVGREGSTTPSTTAGEMDWEPLSVGVRTSDPP